MDMLFHADIRLIFDVPDEAGANAGLTRLEGDIRKARAVYRLATAVAGDLLSGVGKVTPAPAAGSTQPTPTKSFHMPNLKPRDDMGGLMGSG